MHEEGNTQTGGVGKESRKHSPFLGVLHSQVLSLCQGAGGIVPAGPALPSCVLSPASLPRPLRK